MKHSATDTIYQTNLLRALQKNKIIQNKLNESQHSYYVKLLKDMQTYNVKEKYNRELLYAWEKETYIRQLRKDLQRQRVKDVFYEYRVQKLGEIMAGQQTVVIPQSEEDRRLDIHVKYRRFLEKNPLQSSSMNFKSGSILTEQSDQEDQEEEEEEEETARTLEETWKHVHAKSAVASRRKSNNLLPNIHRPSTINIMRRNQSSAKTATSPEVLHSSFDDQPFPTSVSPIDLETLEPLNITSDIIDKHTRADLETMRSVRRPRQNPFEANLLFETRKQIYQINKRALEVQLHQRKSRLTQTIQLQRFKPEEFVEKIRQQEADKQPSVPVITGFNKQHL